MPANSRRRSNDVLQSPGFIGAAARFWQVCEHTINLQLLRDDILIRFFQRSYASDYVGIAMLITGWIVIQFFGDPFHRMFSLDNLNIQYPHAEIERVSVCTSVLDCPGS